MWCSHGRLLMSSRQVIQIDYSPRFPQTDIHRAIDSHRFVVVVAQTAYRDAAGAYRDGVGACQDAPG